MAYYVKTYPPHHHWLLLGEPTTSKVLKCTLFGWTMGYLQLHTLLRPDYWHVATPTLHLHPPTHKKPLHSPTRQSNTPNSPLTPIQSNKDTRCYTDKPTQPALRHHNPIMINSMHMPPQHKHMHGSAKTRDIVYIRGPINTPIPPNPSRICVFWPAYIQLTTSYGSWWWTSFLLRFS